MDGGRTMYLCLTLVGITLLQSGAVDAVCTYTEISASLNTCTSVASGTSNTRWLFPYGTTAQQATFCQSDKQTALYTCVQGVIWPCMSYAKVIKTFGTNGTNLINAYTALCADSLIIDAQACMSVISPIGTYTTAETTYLTSADTLQTAASNMELCGLILTLKYTAYTTLLSATCTTSSHLAVWSDFYDHVLNTYVCTTCAGSDIKASLLFSAFMMVVVRVLRM